MLIEILILSFLLRPILHTQTTPSSLRTSPAITEVMDEFKTAGMTPILIQQKLHRPMFSSEGMIICIDRDNIQIFEYADRLAAKQDFHMLEQKYSNDATTPLSKNSTHIYMTNNILIFYMGTNTDILSVLNNLP